MSNAILYNKLTSFCFVGHWSIQSLSFSFCLYAQIPCPHKASITSIARMSHHHHHHHEREQHEEGHQTRHGSQYVVCSHSSSWVIWYWGPSGREINLYSYKVLLSSHILAFTGLQLGNMAWKSHKFIWKYCSHEKLTNNKDYLRLKIKI